MDLLLKVGILIVIVIAIIGGVLLLVNHHTGSTAITMQKAEQTVLSDVSASNPNATVSVISISNSTIETNSWVVILSVVYNATKPCPTLKILGYDYPATGLVPSIDNLYTKDCVIYGLTSAPTYVISSPEIAIVRAYISNTPSLTGYVNTYGYGNTNVYAKFYYTLNSSATPLNASYMNVWLVNFTAVPASYNQYAILNQSGAIEANFTVSKH